MSIVIGDRFAYQPSLYELLCGHTFQLYFPPVEFAAAMDSVEQGEIIQFIRDLPDCEGVTIKVSGVPDGTQMKQLVLPSSEYSVLFYIDPAPKADRILMTCDSVTGNPTALRTMGLSAEQLGELLGVCRDFVAIHEVTPIEKPVAQSKGPAKKAKPVDKADKA